VQLCIKAIGQLSQLALAHKISAEVEEGGVPKYVTQNKISFPASQGTEVTKVTGDVLY